MIVFSCLIGLLAFILLLPVLSDLTSLLALIGRAPRSRATPETPRLLFLVPAHNEELLLGATLTSLALLDYPRTQYEVVVVADNCTDGTAVVATASGVRCLERHDLSKRGKPYAIVWALSQVDLDAFDAAVVIDADSIVDRLFARAVADAGAIRGRAAQTYIDIRNPHESALTVLGATFSIIRFRLMNALKRRAGLTVPFGNGLVLGIEILRAEGWQAFSICEDWEEYALLTACGVDIENVPAARTYTQEARSLAQSVSQRRRWAAGKFDVLFGCGGRLLRSNRIGARQKLDALAELSAPGPVVTLALAVVLGAAAVVLNVPGRALLLAALILPVGRLGVYTVMALRLESDPWRAARAFAYLPIYLLWRLVVQFASLTMIGRGRWVRTARHREVADRSVLDDTTPSREVHAEG